MVAVDCNKCGSEFEVDGKDEQVQAGVIKCPDCGSGDVTVVG